MSQENRTFSRIKSQIRAYARKVPSPQSSALFRGTAASPMDANLANLKKNTTLPEALISLLGDINTKLDSILNAMHNEFLLKDFPHSIDVVEISGAGVLFLSKSGIDIGDHLEIVLTLSQFPMKLASVVGTVKRLHGTEGSIPCYAFSYTNLRESDRESIVQFVFQEQREMIREKKNGQ